MADAAKGLMKFIMRIIRLLIKLTKSLSAPSLENYFLWTAVFYGIIGVVGIIFYSPVKQFFCDTPETLLENPANCSAAACGDKLLMCGKPPCWRYAMNYTYLVDAKTPNNQRYGARIAAGKDDACNDLVATADGPVKMLQSIVRRRSKNPAEPGAGCVTFHCQVMLNAVLGNELGRGVNGVCTNVKNVKPKNVATDCPCNNELGMLNLDTAADFQRLCGSMANNLSSPAVFSSILRASKDACYAENYIIEKQERAGTPDERSINSNANCSFLTQAVDTSFYWFTELERQQGLNPRFDVQTPCKLLFCDVFIQTLSANDCEWQTDTKLQTFTKSDYDNIAKNCNGDRYSKQVVCTTLSSVAKWVPSWCLTGDNAITITTTTPASPGGADIRLRLLAAGLDVESETLSPCGSGDGDNRLCPVANSDGQTEVLALASANSTRQGQLQQGQVPHEDALQKAHLERRLQDAAPAPAASANNADLQAYSTTAWSSCTCLFQCIDGIKTRSVVCPPGEKCAEPKPPSSEACTCNHCSKCFVIVLQIIAYASFGQVFFCLVAFLSFFKVSGLGEDDFSEIGICTKIVGCLCRSVPCIVKSLVWLIMYVILFLVLEVSIPSIQKDCSTSQNLKVATAMIAIFWGIQLLFGFTFKKFKQKPPWLHTPTTSNFMKLIAAPLRLIGP